MPSSGAPQRSPAEENQDNASEHHKRREQDHKLKFNHLSDTEIKMRVAECVILSVVFMVSPPHCSSSTIQQQNRTALPVRAALLADATVERCGEADNNTKVQQTQKRLKGFPGGRTPLDPLSVSPVKPKRERSRRIKPSQKRRPATGSLDQITTIPGESVTPVRSGDRSSADQAENNRSSSQQKLEPTQRLVTTERTISDHLRIRLPKVRSRTGFGLPIDRIGHGRMPSGRR
ncbi:hypothetical protein AOLI_G00213040 [Acnodon oligacanthus]